MFQKAMNARARATPSAVPSPLCWWTFGAQPEGHSKCFLLHMFQYVCWQFITGWYGVHLHKVNVRFILGRSHFTRRLKEWLTLRIRSKKALSTTTNWPPHHLLLWNTKTGWFGTWLLFFHSVGNVIIPTDELIFYQRGRYTTNQTISCGYELRVYGLSNSPTTADDTSIIFSSALVEWFKIE